MKTNNYKLELMVPLQTDQEVTFNEAMIVLDSFCNGSIQDFKSEIPENLNLNEKFIISEGEHINKICYHSHFSKKIQLLKPIEGMIFYLKSKKTFIIFETEEWVKLNFCQHQD